MLKHFSLSACPELGEILGSYKFSILRHQACKIRDGWVGGYQIKLKVDKSPSIFLASFMCSIITHSRASFVYFYSWNFFAKVYLWLEMNLTVRVQRTQARKPYQLPNDHCFPVSCDWFPPTVRGWGWYEPFLAWTLEKFYTSPTVFFIHNLNSIWRMADEIEEHCLNQHAEEVC